MNPYLIDEPAVISFSGGRTSAYMLYKVLEAHGGRLPDHVVVAFSNTGKEMPQTLDFVDRCSKTSLIGAQRNGMCRLFGLSLSRKRNLELSWTMSRHQERASLFTT